jgi:anti-sigma factor RsiW
MNCDQVRDLLEAHVDGGLGDAAGREVDRHLARCPACSARLSRLRSLLADAQGLPRSIEPPRDLWPAISARLPPRSALPLRRARRTRTVTLRAPWLAAAAVALIVMSSSVTLLLRRGASEPAAGAGVGLPASIVALEGEYTTAAAEIASVLEQQRGALPREAVAALERSLRVLDDAIAESRGALARDPANAQLSQLLLATYQRKLDVLKRASFLAGSL